MPATIIGSSEWNAKGIILSSQSAQEQVNGLVNVQVQYAIPASKQYEIDQMFYVDAPPPIWPTVVNRSEMMTNNLYMVQRSVSRANGLVIVNAEYVSGLTRAGFRGYFLRETKEPRKRATAYDYVSGATLFQSVGFGSTSLASSVVYTPSGAERYATFGRAFIYSERVKIVEYVKVAGASFVQPPTFTRSDLASSIFANQQNYYDRTRSVEFADLWVVAGEDDLYSTGIRSFEMTTTAPFTESSSYITPRVEVVTLEYRLTR